MKQMIYPKQPKILIDPATGQQVLMTPKHGLFFIPAKAWTWILGILAVPMMLLGAVGESGEAKAAATPGYKEFEAADDLISTKSKGGTHGNTDAAKASAAEFSAIMKSMTDVLFTGGSKKNLMTGGDFLTYCHDGADTVVFLCHVPSLLPLSRDTERMVILTAAAFGAVIRVRFGFLLMGAIHHNSLFLR